MNYLIGFLSLIGVWLGLAMFMFGLTAQAHENEALYGGMIIIVCLRIIKRCYDNIL